MTIDIENQLPTPPSSHHSHLGSLASTADPTTANPPSTVAPAQSPELPPRPDLRPRFFDTRYKKCVFIITVLLMYIVACLCAVQALMPVVAMAVLACVLMIPVIFLAFAFVMYSLFRSNVRPVIASIISVVLATLYVVACGIVYTYAPDKNPYFIFNLWFIFIPVGGVLVFAVWLGIVATVRWIMK